MKAKQLLLAATTPVGFTLGLLLLLNHSPSPTTAADTTPSTIHVALSCTGVPTPCYTTLQAGVNAATGGELIKVATGTYVGTGDNVVEIDKTVTIRGGYSVNFAMWDPDTFPTTLDGEGARRAVRISAGYSPTLEGLRMINGWADSSGGSLYSWGANPIIRDCEIFNSTAMNGGSIYLGGCQGCTLTNGRIHSSTSTVDGAGVYLENCIDATLSDNHIHSTTAGRDGAGVFLYDCTNTTLLDNYIFSNTVGLSVNYGGGIYVYDSDYTTLQGNTIYTNSAYVGGGIAIRNSDSLTLLGNEIHSNMSIAGGGGVWAFNSHDSVIAGNVIHENLAQDIYTFFGGGGIKIYSGTNTLLTNNIVWGNSSGGTGSGVFLHDSDAHMLHNTLVGNTGGEGHGAFVYNSSLWMTNTILAQHLRGIETDGGGTASLHHTLWPFAAWSNVTPTLGSGIVQYAGLAGFAHFLDPNNGNFHIRRGSAAIDNGLSTSLVTDIDGHPRPIGQLPDIGADEFWGWLCVPLVMREF